LSNATSRLRVFCRWSRTLVIGLVFSTPAAAQPADENVPATEAGAHYFLAGGIPGETFECAPAKMSFDAYLKFLFDHFAKDSFIDVLSFQGRLPGTKGLEVIERSDVDGDISHSSTWVVSDSLANCQRAASRYSEVREAIERSKWVGFDADQKARGRKDRSKGRVIFTMTCYQRRAASGSMETRCETIKPCRMVKLENQDPRNPLNVQVPCRTASLMVE
jgi:hypothetical protein